eukprot:TRINITY_DN2926_c1_g2_i2.p1 TRINITY_DN2926_c1_g2~~TRINITY_DN2926_c1_g2_i2.p1  ORF type:complete len:1371 (-),score=385.78 TRINITY_DN2926_c1_g2_i2:338-4450(-)
MSGTQNMSTASTTSVSHNTISTATHNGNTAIPQPHSISDITRQTSTTSTSSLGTTSSRKQSFDDFCLRLNIDHDTRTQSWALLDKFTNSYQGSQEFEHYWSSCAIYVVSSNGMGQGTCGVPLSQLLREDDIKLYDFFTPLRIFLTTLDLPTKIVEKLELKYVVDGVLYEKYQRSFNKFFKIDISSIATPVKPSLLSSKKQDDMSHARNIYKFGWFLFLVAKGKLLQNPGDFMQSLHLLLVCIDLLLLHAPNDIRKVSLKEIRAFLEHRSEMLSNNNNNVVGSNNSCIVDSLYYICSINHANYNQVKDVQQRIFIPWMKTLCTNNIILYQPAKLNPNDNPFYDSGNETSINNHLENTTLYLGGLLEFHLDENVKKINKEYQMLLYTNCDFNEAHFIENPTFIQSPVRPTNSTYGLVNTPTKYSPSPVPSNLYTNPNLATPGKSHLWMPMTPVKTSLSSHDWLLTTISILPEELSSWIQEMLVSNNKESGSNSNYLEKIKSGLSEKLNNLMSLVDFQAENEERRRLTIKLYYRLLDSIMKSETKRLARSDFIEAMIKQEVFLKSLLSCSLEIIISVYQIGDFKFPASLKLFDICPYEFYSIIESVAKTEFTLPRPLVKHLIRIEERILEEIAWEYNSNNNNVQTGFYSSNSVCALFNESVDKGFRQKLYDIMDQEVNAFRSNYLNFHQPNHSTTPTTTHSINNPPPPSPRATRSPSPIIINSKHVNIKTDNVKTTSSTPPTLVTSSSSSSSTNESTSSTQSTTSTEQGTEQSELLPSIKVSADAKPTVVEPVKVKEEEKSTENKSLLSVKIPTTTTTTTMTTSTTPTSGSIPTSSTGLSQFVGTPSLSTVPNTPSKSGAALKRLSNFLRKVTHLAMLRIHELYRDLALTTTESSAPTTIPQNVIRQVELMFINVLIFKTHLFQNRHIDQFIMCILYGLCKINKVEITFKQIIEKYLNQPQATSQIFRTVRLQGAKFGDVIKFYNTVFLNDLESMLLEYEIDDSDNEEKALLNQLNSIANAQKSHASNIQESHNISNSNNKSNIVLRVSSPLHLHKSPQKIPNLLVSPRRGSSLGYGCRTPLSIRDQKSASKLVLGLRSPQNDFNKINSAINSGNSTTTPTSSSTTPSKSTPTSSTSTTPKSSARRQLNFGNSDTTSTKTTSSTSTSSSTTSTQSTTPSSIFGLSPRKSPSQRTLTSPPILNVVSPQKSININNENITSPNPSILYSPLRNPFLTHHQTGRSPISKIISFPDGSESESRKGNLTTGIQLSNNTSSSSSTSTASDTTNDNKMDVVLNEKLGVTNTPDQSLPNKMNVHSIVATTSINTTGETKKKGVKRKLDTEAFNAALSNQDNQTQTPTQPQLPQPPATKKQR